MVLLCIYLTNKIIFFIYQSPHKQRRFSRSHSDLPVCSVHQTQLRLDSIRSSNNIEQHYAYSNTSLHDGRVHCCRYNWSSFFIFCLLFSKRFHEILVVFSHEDNVCSIVWTAYELRCILCQLADTSIARHDTYCCHLVHYSPLHGTANFFLVPFQTWRPSNRLHCYSLCRSDIAKHCNVHSTSVALSKNCVHPNLYLLTIYT